MNGIDMQTLIRQLWPNGESLSGEQVYMVLDGARDPVIAPLVRSGQLEYVCLYSGMLSPRLQAAAPYIIHLSPDSALTHTLLDKGWGNSWGFLTVVPPHVTLYQQRLHFKKLLRVRDENGVELNFRFYDPRVMRIYVPTCTQDELRQFFGPVTRIVVEADDARNLISYDSHAVVYEAILA